jgi:hypothetical protein
VQKGTGGLNSLSFDLDTATFKPDEYIVTVSAVLQDVKRSNTFTLTEQRVTLTTAPTTIPVTTHPPPTTVTTVAVPQATRKTPVETGIILTGFFIALILWYNHDKL